MPIKSLEKVRLVIKGRKKTILVVEIFENIKIPFVLIDNKPVRGDGYVPNRPRVNKNVFRAMARQAVAILSDKARTIGREAEVISVSKLLTGETERLNRLVNFKCFPLTNGGIRIFRWRIKNEKKVLIPQVYKNIESAIRAQEHIIDGYKSKIKESPSEIKDLEYLILYTARLKEVLILEQNSQKANLKSAFHVLRALSASPDSTLYKNQIAEEKLNKVLCYLQSVWSNPFFEPAQSAMEIINYVKQFLPTASPNGLRALASSAATILEF